MAYRDDVLDVMRSLIAANFPRAFEGSMFGSIAWFTDNEGGKKGKLFCAVFDEGITIKLPRERIEALVDENVYLNFEPYGMPKMREWLYVVRSDAEDYSSDLPLLEEACRFVVAETKQVI
jgi:hypothetical protein